MTKGYISQRFPEARQCSFKGRYFVILAWAASSRASEPLSKGHVISMIRVRSSSSTTMSGRRLRPESRMVLSVVMDPNLMESVILVTSLL